MCKANKDQSLMLLKILEVYGAATCQTINLNKSSITFGSKVQENLKKDIQDILRIQNKGGARTYLGLPEYFSGSKVEMLGYIKDMLKSKLSGWFSRYCSNGNASFCHVLFQVPKTNCSNLSSAMTHFWWSSFEHNRKINWQSWERMCLPISHGGLGFHDIQLFNQALLAK